MLPFLKKQVKHQSGVLVKHRPSDEMSSKDDTSPLEIVAKDLLSAIASQDAKRLSEVLKDAFTILDAEPHIEGPHINEEEE